MRDRLEEGGRGLRQAMAVAGSLAVVMVLVAAAPPAAAQQPSAGEVFSEFLACEAVPDPTEQLICFRTALKKYKARFGLLSGRAEDAARENPAALPAPDQKIFSADRGGSPNVSGGSPNASRGLFVGERGNADSRGPADAVSDYVEGTIVRARKNVYGYWILTLDNGQVWKEASGLRLPDNIELAGRRATIEKSVVGSRWISIEGVRGKARVVPVR